MNTCAPGGLVVMVVVVSPIIIWTLVVTHEERATTAPAAKSERMSEPPLEQVDLESGAPLAAHHLRQRADGRGAQRDGAGLVGGHALPEPVQAAGGEVRHPPARRRTGDRRD